MRSAGLIFRSWAILALTLLSVAFGGVWAAEPEISLPQGGPGAFASAVQPILERHCYQCHSHSAEKIKGGLVLDSLDGLRQGGDTGPLLVPGDPDSSRLIIAVRHNDPDLRMPPKTRLSDPEIETLTQWVKRGAPELDSPSPNLNTGGSPSGYRVAKELWSASPVVRPKVPLLQSGPQPADPIDAFVKSRLEAQSLPQVPPAAKPALLRRVFFDLTGLPPSPSEMRAFLADPSPESFALVVDRLLDSPHFGERWARHWLDLARYADSNGLDQNIPFPNAWRYRDYVVQAFNTDKPYDQFIREQLAGDLLPAANREDQHQKWIATGFLMLGPKNFGEPNRDKLFMDIADEQIDVTSRAMLGLTASCARCHDHKFDPIPTRDYYAMAGIFRSTQTLANADRPGQNASPFAERPLGTEAQIAAFDRYQGELAVAENRRNAARRLAQNLPGGIDSKELDGIVLDNLQAEAVGGWALSNYSTNFVDKNYLHDGNEKQGKGKKLVRFRPEIPESGLYEIRLAFTARPNRAPNVPVRVTAGSPPGSEDGPVPPTRTVYLNQQVAPQHNKAFESLGFFHLEKGTNNQVEVGTEGTKGFVVVDAAQFLPQDVQLAARFRKAPSARPEMNEMMADVSAAQLQELEYKLMELMGTPPPDLPAGLPTAMAVREGEIQTTKIHIRGDPERLGAEVPRGFLSLLGHASAGAFEAGTSGRQELAGWIAHPQNPLTARVMVNRLWQHLFGRGLVGTPDNFGMMGEKPTHPELLDYLAAEFVDQGWSVKKLIRRLVLTETYQLSTRIDPRTHALDPENRLFWRMNRKRLEAESLRDAILAANGSLDRTIGGDPGGPPPNQPPAAGGPLESSNRRSLYLPVLRGNLNDLFQVFDFPDPHALSGRRFTTTAPTQALFLMNSPFMLTQARRWAEQLLAQSGASDDERIAEVYLAAFGRTCAPKEKERAASFLAQFEAALTPADPESSSRRVQAWQAFCQAMLQSTEFIFIN